MLAATWCRYTLQFHEVAITSRSVMRVKDTYFLKLYDRETPEVFGVGECALFKGLSSDDQSDYEEQLQRLCESISSCNTVEEIPEPTYSSIRFGLECAIKDFINGGRRILFDTPWSKGEDEITINGLVWMGTAEQMSARIKEKLDRGFRCLKLKIGGVDFNDEVELLKYIRHRFTSATLELRLDANGAFTPDNALSRLETLAQFDIHSIEQPIKQNQREAMRLIVNESPIPIALDEELIGTNTRTEKEQLLDFIKPHYIILKPSLCGGIEDASQWIALAEQRRIGWWGTSALESNVGLNAIAQWLSTYNPTMPQGLGTGALYTNNIPSPIVQTRDVLRYDSASSWNLEPINHLL